MNCEVIFPKTLPLHYSKNIVYFIRELYVIEKKIDFDQNLNQD